MRLVFYNLCPHEEGADKPDIPIKMLPGNNALNVLILKTKISVLGTLKKSVLLT